MKKNNRLSAIWVRSLFLGIAFSYHGLPVSAQQLHIESKSQSLKSIMQQIEKQSGYSFLYDEKTINLNRKVSLQMKSFWTISSFHPLLVKLKLPTLIFSLVLNPCLQVMKDWSIIPILYSVINVL